MSTVFILFLLFGLPFIILPIGASFFESPKVILAEGVIVLLAGWMLFFQKKQFSFTTTHILLLGVFVLSAFHLVFLSSQNTFLGNAFRGQGILLLWCMILFAFVVSQVKGSKIPQLLIPLILFLQVIASIFIEAKEGRAIGTLGEPNALSAFAIFIWPFVLSNHKSPTGNQKNIFIVISIALTILLIVFSGSRSGLVALGIQIFFWFVTRFISLKKAVVIAILILIISLLPTILDKETLYENRGEIWTTALYAGYEHPISGWGFGNTEVAFKEYNEKLYNRLRGYYIDSSHNVVLDWWVQGGFVGVVILLLLLLDTAKRLIKLHNRIYLLLFLGLISVMTFNPVSVVAFVQFWWLIGYAATASNSSNPTT